jgi:phage tail protein X
MGGILQKHRLFLLGPLAASVLLLSGGCGGDNGALPPEADEPLYREGVQLGKQGRTQEALNDYLKVIAKRGDLAPESHLNAGLIYLGDIKDPIAAIYHFRKYLELAPNSAQAENVRELIDTAKRDFARTLPGDPLSSQVGDATLIERLDSLQRENQELRAELAATRDGSSAAPSSPSALPAPAASAPPARPLFVVPSSGPAADEAVPSAVPVPEAVPAAPVESPIQAQAPAPPPAPSRPASRHYTVAAHDTLYGIAKKVYGSATNAKVQAILQANRGILPSARDLRPGMELQIP